MTAIRDLDLGPAFTPAAFPVAFPPDIFVQPISTTKPMWQRAIQARRVAFEHEPDLPDLGAILGDYRLDRAIGLGGLGAVYCARHVVDDSVVAIKVIRPSVAADQPHITRQIAEEARAAAQLAHEHVVQIHDVVRTDRTTYIVTEYVDGPDLSVLIKRRGALPPKLVVRLIRHIASALDAGLTHHLVHRDIKPSNILLTLAGVTKITDFGLARASSAATTTTYLSPEQLVDPTRACARADIYSLGVTAYHALTGMLPVPDGRAVLPPDRIASAVPPALSSLIVRMLATRPADRPGDYAQLDAELRDLPGW